MAKLIFGCGYLGQRVARRWHKNGEHVITVTRSENRAVELGKEGFFTAQADVTRAETLERLRQMDFCQPAVGKIDTVLFAVGFDRSVGNSIHDVYAEGVKNVLATLPSSVRQFIYISTTGVYGDADGAWVDESTPPDPQRDGGKASLAAEQLLGRNGIILRFAGIYGPDRIPYLAKLSAGEPIGAPSKGWLNLIHVDDGAQIVIAAEKWGMAKPQAAGAVFCVSDGNPVIRGDYYREVARRIGAAEPNFVVPDQGSPAAARASADKRISNAKLVEQLGYEFAYPSYREGLEAIL